MRPGPRYRVKPRRRRDGITDYRKRLNLLRSRKTRIVIRKSLKHTRVQFVEYDSSGDKILANAISNELVSNYNWKFSTSTTPAAYLTGFLAGTRAKNKGISECVLDSGRHPPITGSKIFASVKGLVDAGIECIHSEEKLPNEDRLMGKHLTKEILELDRKNIWINTIFSGVKICKRCFSPNQRVKLIALNYSLLRQIKNTKIKLECLDCKKRRDLMINNLIFDELMDFLFNE